MPHPFMTTIASTQRADAMDANDIIDSFADKLTALRIFGPNPLSAQSQQEVRKSMGIEGTSVVIREAFTESHAHVDEGIAVNQMPDIKEGDRMIVDGITYSVKLGQSWGATSGFGETLHLYLVLDKGF